MTGTLSRFRQLPAASRILVLEAIAILPILGTSNRVFGFPRLWRLLRRLTRESQMVALGVQTETADQQRKACVQSVDIACRHHLWHPSCLTRSLALWYLLRRRRIPAELQIGVSKQLDKLLAHAWVESEGQVLNDTPDVRTRFSAFHDLASALAIRPADQQQ